MGKARPIKRCVLPDGTEVYCLNPREAKLISKEVRGYLKRGIELKEEAVVFDVGANIGIFTIAADRVTGGTARIYAFEPVPEIFDVLRANTREMSSDRVRIFPLGMGRVEERVRFSYFPKIPAMSRRGPGFTKEELAEFRNQFVEKIGVLKENAIAPWYLRWVDRFPLSMKRWFIGWRIKKSFQGKEVECQLSTLSDVLTAEGADCIDLLKVDVEGAELDVLKGLRNDDLKKVRQLVAEVHDIDDRVETIRKLLVEAEFESVKVYQEPIRRDTGIFTIYALRG